MKKALILAAGVLLIVALVAPSAMAAIGSSNGYSNQFFDQMFDWHDQWLDNAVKNGQITEDQAKAWEDHFNYMRDFHNQYGFGMMGGMMGGFGGNGNYGYGMMGGYNGDYGSNMMGGYGNYGGMQAQ